MANNKRGSRKKPHNRKISRTVDDSIRFIVPMPGRSSWHVSPKQPGYSKLHTFTDLAGDYALEDYQAQFLMQREYLID